MTKGRGLKRFISLFFFLFLLPACFTMPKGGKPGSDNTLPPSTPDPRPWENLPNIDLNWIKPEFGAVVTNMAYDRTNINFPFSSTQRGTPLIFRPNTGLFRSIGVSSSSTNAMGVYFTLSPEIDQSLGKFESHTYFNGQYESSNVAHDFSNTNPHKYYLYIRNFGYTITTSDSWYFIFVFRGTDEKDYKYRSPDISVKNAL